MAIKFLREEKGDGMSREVKSTFEVKGHIQTRCIVGQGNVYLDVVDTRDESMLWSTTVPLTGAVRDAQLEQAKRALIARGRG